MDEVQALGQFVRFLKGQVAFDMRAAERADGAAGSTQTLVSHRVELDPENPTFLRSIPKSISQAMRPRWTVDGQVPGGELGVASDSEGSGVDITLTADMAAGGFVASDLPEGLTITNDGRISGMPSQPGTHNFSVTLVGVFGLKTVKEFTVVAAKTPVWAFPAPDPAPVRVVVNRSFTLQLVADHAAPDGFKLGSLAPFGIVMQPSGIVTGSLGSLGQRSVVVYARSIHSDQVSSSAQLMIDAVNAPAWTTPKHLADTAAGRTMASVQMEAEGASRFQLLAGGLPFGTSLLENGLLQGTPTARGVHVFTLRASNDDLNGFSDRTFVLAIAAVPVWVTQPHLRTVTAGRPFDFTLQAQFASQFTVTNPAWVAVRTSKLVGSAPADGAGSSQEVTVHAVSVDSHAITTPQTFSFSLVAAPEWTLVYLPDQATSEPVDETRNPRVEASGAQAYAAVGNMPGSLIVNGTSGLISGTMPSFPGTHVFVVQADNGAVSGTVQLTCTILAAVRPVWGISALVPMAKDRVASQTVVMSALGYWEVTWADGASPAGVEFDADTSVLSGTATETGTYQITLKAVSMLSPDIFSTRTLDLQVNLPPAWETAGTLASAATDVPMSAQLAASPADAYDVVSGSVLAGLSLDRESGLLSGRAYKTETTSFTVRATSLASMNATTDRQFTQVASASPVWQTRAGALQQITKGRSFYLEMRAYGSRKYTRMSGSLPAGASATEQTLNPSEHFVMRGQKFSGYYADKRDWFDTASTTGNPFYANKARFGSEGSDYSYRWYALVRPKFATKIRFITSTDDASHVYLDGHMIVDNGGRHGELRRASPDIVMQSDQDYELEVLYGQGFGGAIMNLLFQYGPANGSIDEADCDDLSLVFNDARHASFRRYTLQGTSGSTGTWDMSMRATGLLTDAVYTDQSFSVTSIDPPAWNTGGTLADVAYDETFPQVRMSASSATSYTRQSGTIPDGLSLSSEGLLTGKPTSVNTFTFTVRAESASAQNHWEDRDFTQLVARRPIWPSWPTGYNLMQNVTKHRYCILSNADAQYANPNSYKKIDGTLPYNMTLSETGDVSGTPNQLGTCQWRTEAQSTTSTSIKSSAVYRTTIVDPPTWSTGSSLVDVARNESISNIQFSASGADSYVRQSGTIPTGLSLSSSGVLSGTPTAANSFSFTVRATDNAAQSCWEDRTFSMLVAVRPTWPAQTIPKITKGQYCEFTATANDAKSDGYSAAWVVGTSNPGGFNVNSRGKCYGTPKRTGSYDLRVTAQSTSSSSVTADYTFAVVVVSAPSWSTNGNVGDIEISQPFDLQLSASGATRYSKLSGKYPAGLSMTNDYRIAGTPTTDQTRAFTIRAESDSALKHYTDLQFSITVVGPPNFTGARTSPYDIKVLKPLQDYGLGHYRTDISSTYEIINRPHNVTLDNNRKPQGLCMAYGDVALTVRAYRSNKFTHLYTESSFTLRSSWDFGLSPFNVSIVWRSEHDASLKTHFDLRCPDGTHLNYLTTQDRDGAEYSLCLRVIHTNTWGTEFTMVDSNDNHKATLMGLYNAGTWGQNMNTYVKFTQDNGLHYFSYVRGDGTILQHLTRGYTQRIHAHVIVDPKTSDSDTEWIYGMVFYTADDTLVQYIGDMSGYRYTSKA